MELCSLIDVGVPLRRKPGLVLSWSKDLGLVMILMLIDRYDFTITSVVVSN